MNLNNIMANKNIRNLSARKELDTNLFEEIAQKAVDNENAASFKKLAKDFLIDDSVIYGTASFYDFTKEENRNKKVHICNGTACMTAGTQKNLKDRITPFFNDEEIGHAACLGHCHTNHAFMINDTTYSAKSEEEVAQIIKNTSSNFQTGRNSYKVDCNTTPILTGKIDNIASFYKLASSLSNKNEKVIQEIKQSKLRGRGGAGFPFWFKLDAVIKEENPQKYIVCNADEGDPGAFSDMYLLEHQAHKVLFGMYISGLTVGADTGVLYIRGEYPDSIKKVEKAIEEFYALGLEKPFRFKIIRGQGSYVCGEETALLNSIEGMRPEVRVRPPYPAQYGLYGKPTVFK